jgi:hypothetical protein
MAAEIFLQHFENRFIKHLIEQKKIIFCARYVHDVLVIYDKTKKLIQTWLTA